MNFGCKSANVFVGKQSINPGKESTNRADRSNSTFINWRARNLSYENKNNKYMKNEFVEYPVIEYLAHDLGAFTGINPVGGGEGGGR